MIKPKQCTLPNGMDVDYSSNVDFLQREVFDEHLYNKHGIEPKNGDCIFDVGANIGFFVMFLNEQLDDASVYSFEPIPDTFELLKRNAKRHNRLDLKMFNCGLSDEPGTATFTHYPKSNLCSTMFPQGSAEYLANSREFVISEFRSRSVVLKAIVDRTPRICWWPIAELVRRYYRTAVKIQCELRTISDIIDENDIQKIDYLKIDTEGAEMKVLGGIRPEHWPVIRQVVVEAHEGKEGLAQVVDLLQSVGFKTTTEQPCDTLTHLHMVYATRVDSLDN